MKSIELLKNLKLGESKMRSVLTFMSVGRFYLPPFRITCGLLHRGGCADRFFAVSVRQRVVDGRRARFEINQNGCERQNEQRSV